MKARWIIPAVALPLAWAAPARAGPIYGFVGVTNTNMTNVAIGQAQLGVEVNDGGDGQVSFTFFILGGAPASITDVYFDDGTLLGIAELSDSGDGVAFSQGAVPHNLPGGDLLDPDFVTTAGFSADSDEPPVESGVNAPSESLTILFNLINGQSYQNTINAIEGKGPDSLRIGIHVQAIGTGGSESFLNVPTEGGPPIVPLPLAILGGAMLMGLVARRRAR